MKAKNILLIVLGTATLAFGTAVFILPFNIVYGGVSGISIVLDALIPLPYLTVDLLITIITWTLFFIGLFVLGRSFALKTLISTVIYPILISVFSLLTRENVLGGFFRLSNSSNSEITLLLAALFGSVLVGVGCALTFLGGGSTGGVDIIAFMVCKFVKGAKSSYVIFILDAVIIGCASIIQKNLVLTLLGIVSAFVVALAIDKLFLGENDAFTAQIISKKCPEINNAIIEKLGRTTTLFNVTGGYRGEQKQMLTVSFSRVQYIDIVRLVTEIDKSAFVMVHKAHEIRGQGWKV